MSRLPPRLAFYMGELAALAGWPGLVAVLVLLAAAGWQATRLQTLHAAQAAEAQRLQQTERALKRELARLAEPGAQRVVEAAPALLSRQALPGLLGQIEQLAARYAPQDGPRDFLQVAEADGALLRVSSQLSLQQPYPALRRFLAELAALPGVRIESLHLSRAQIEAAAPTALVRFSILLAP